MLKLESIFVGMLIGLGVFSYTRAVGADWKFLETNFQGEFSYDSENITRSSGNIVGVWLKIVYSERFRKQENLTHLNQTIGSWEINCMDRKMCLLSTSHHSEGGEISAPQVWLPPEWKSIAPNTAMDTLYKELCK
jgi:hypothetical protein